jgi:hypothetical protein
MFVGRPPGHGSTSTRSGEGNLLLFDASGDILSRGCLFSFDRKLCLYTSQLRQGAETAIMGKVFNISLAAFAAIGYVSVPSPSYALNGGDVRKTTNKISVPS